jgi:ABC-type transporter Mla subunit MlaD
MPELTLEAIEQLLTKKLEAQTKDLTAKIEASSDELAEMIQFLTKTAAHKTDLAGLSEHVDKKFAEASVSLNFIESQLATLRKDLDQLSRRTKEDDSAFVKDLLKLKHRMDQFEKQLKKLKTVHA